MLSLILLLALAGCARLGIPMPGASAAREAESRAIGSACRHAGRAIEDCYTLNTQADKAAVFAGWREMNDYMRENDIREVTPQLPPPALAKLQKSAAAAGNKPPEDEEEEEEAPPKAQQRGGRPLARAL
ncbi:hypothetical protein [Caldimonas tepidiphila]|uniref:hypothetical protein n=1 Tax=Caldimonas tepidiphila TaxID=2315841 RepID=UPI003012B496